ncbi:uncharacterized protein LOC117787211 [Drosophila innubila]|uniref:uncharacterized protein LOC117787211 n=1 Tax=Drosophila innubila TaxID=198719 RepID=UPI00148DBC2B|nr:uncharacterized protein LOC117787211 [Drosophila innubila]XP_034481567.1 uncharacterized protein LOC117787211 [Drosophila innubila]
MNSQLNPSTYRKFNNLLSSGAVTVTGPGQPRILKTTRLGTPGGGSQNVSASSQQQQQNTMDTDNGVRCYICDELLLANQTQTSLTEMCTTHTSTKFPNKLAQLVGEAFLVIVCKEDFVCSRCTNLVNYYDRLENDVERVKSNLLNLLNKKYGINEDSGGSHADAASPPLKMQKMASNAANRSLEETAGGDVRQRKLVQQSTTVSQQLKVASPQGAAVAGTQTQVQRKATKIYKCTSCDYKTSDMRLFNTHYETCKQQTFQCKTCRKIFPHFGAMKNHMVRDHNTAMDNTCAMCHINFVNENSLRKHMETNHATNVLVTSTTTIPAAAAPATAAAQAAAAAASAGGGVTESISVTGSALYTCNHCQFKSTDKGVFDEHMRKHVTNKPKPFKCRLCSQRFETREAATVHAKQHQNNYFKCGQCAMSFPKRELLVKHAELHQTEKLTTGGGGGQNMNTQKLLQETIDEALSDSVPAQTGSTVVTSAAEAENNIRFFSCSICSLTFIQETYYNHHMETHRRDKKSAGAAGGSGGTTALNSAATALLSDEPGDSGVAMKEESNEQNAEADIESLFEKLHSEKNDSGEKKNEMVITQEGSGGITFNITIPQVDATGDQVDKNSPNSQAPVSVSIDMPVLDQAEEEESQSQGSNDNKSGEARNSKSNAAPVSMPSLDDDNEAAAANAADTTDGNAASSKTGDKANSKTEQAAAKQKAKKAAEEAAETEAEEVKNETEETTAEQAAESAAAEEAAEAEAAAAAAGEGEASEAAGGEQQVAMELDEAMQAQVDGGQIKFIVNENGHLLQLDNHILTDADGNQIIVQDPEQIQQLLQSVGVLQSGEGLEGETLQMMTDGSGQMVLVHGDNNEQQLIDASLLNSEGQIIIQQGQDGEEGPHVISEDGTRIPVSVSYTEDGQPIVQVQQQVLEAAQANAEEKEAAAQAAEEAAEEAQTSEAATVTTAAATAVTTSTASSSSGGTAGFFALEEFAETKAN